MRLSHVVCEDDQVKVVFISCYLFSQPSYAIFFVKCCEQKNHKLHCCLWITPSDFSIHVKSCRRRYILC